MLNDDLRNEVIEVTHPQTKSDFLSRFKSTREAASFLYEYGDIRNRKGDKVSVESLMRRFQTRGGKSQGENAPVYKQVGEELPPKYDKTMTVTIEGKQGNRDRSFTATFRGSDAAAFASSPDLTTFFYQRGYDNYQEMANLIGGDGSGALSGYSITIS